MKPIATAFRKLAKELEQREAECDLESSDRWDNGIDRFFTCNMVEARIGRAAADCYQDIFQTYENQIDLWREGGGCMPIRVLMLCFAAAMAETNDL